MAKAKYKEWLKDDNLTRLKGWARRGLKDEEIAGLIGISRQTLYDWKNKYPDIADALKLGKEIIDDEVEEALIKTMMGYTVTETTFKMVKVDEFVLKARRAEFAKKYKKEHPDASKNKVLAATGDAVPVYEKIPMVVNVKQVGPNTSAIMFWLKNRRPELYRDQNVRKLNEANVERAKAEAEMAKAKAEEIFKITNPAIDALKDLSIDDLKKLANEKDDL